jgi:solute carrier family 31 (copper transporter), member 1
MCGRMLAVMTMNAGYFLSVLAGLFIGELAFGRFASLEDGHH